MSRLATRAELDKLGGALGVSPTALEFLNPVPAEQLRGLRVALYEQMFEDDRDLFRRLGALARRLPDDTVLWTAQRLGPLVTARVLAEVPSPRAARLAARAPTRFLADVCVNLDPRRTHDVIRRLSIERVIDVARELIDRGDHMTMSRFVDFLTEDAIVAVVEAIEDEGELMRIAFYMGSKNRVDHLFRLLGPDRLQRLLGRVEEQSEQLLSPFLSLLIHVSYRLKRELGDLAAAREQGSLEGLIRAVHDQGLWGDALPVVAAMSPEARHKVVNLPALADPAVQASIIEAADGQQLWGIVLPMVELMDDPGRDAVAQIVAAKGAQTLEVAADAALMGEHWELLLDLVRRMPAAKQEELGVIVRRLGEVDPGLMERLERRAAAHGVTG
jgi:hypothetical protein